VSRISYETACRNAARFIGTMRLSHLHQGRRREDPAMALAVNGAFGRDISNKTAVAEKTGG